MKARPKTVVRRTLIVWLLAWTFLASTAFSKDNQSSRNGGHDLKPSPTPPPAQTPEPTSETDSLIKELMENNEAFLNKVQEVYRKAGVDFPLEDPATVEELNLFPQKYVSKAQKLLNLEDRPKEVEKFRKNLLREIAARKLIKRALTDAGYKFNPECWDLKDVAWENVTPFKHSNLAALQSPAATPAPAAATPVPKDSSPPPSNPKPAKEKPAEPAANIPTAPSPMTPPPAAATPAPQPATAETSSPKPERAKALQNEINATKGEIKELKESQEKDSHELRNDLNNFRDQVDQNRHELDKKLTDKLQESSDQNQRLFIIFGVLIGLSFLATVYAILRKPAKASVDSPVGFDAGAREGVRELKQTVDTLNQAVQYELAARGGSGPALTAAALAEVKTALETQLRALQGKLASAERETSQLRSQLVLGTASLEQFRQELLKAFADASASARPLIGSVSRLGERMEVDSFRKLARDRVEWTMLKDLTAEIERSLSEAESLVRNLPGQLYVWEQPRFQAAVERCAQIQQNVARAASLRTSLMRILLPAYRTVAQREPLPKALEYARDLALVPSNGSLSWTMECDGQGISADPNDARAPWHLRGSKRAGNRTALFPLCTENGTQLFPGVVTYEV